MQSDEIRNAYQRFFLKSEGGEYFMNEVRRLIADSHQKAEKNADNARDFSQQARGVRLVEEHIQSVMTEVKKS